jgi:hypothetical protein
MTERERRIHAAAFATTRAIECVAAFPREQRALVFFKVFQRLKRSLEGLSSEASCDQGQQGPAGGKP